MTAANRGGAAYDGGDGEMSVNDSGDQQIVPGSRANNISGWAALAQPLIVRGAILSAAVESVGLLRGRIAGRCVFAVGRFGRTEQLGQQFAKCRAAGLHAEHFAFLIHQNRPGN